MSFFTKRYHTPGTAPGSLIKPKAETAIPLHIKLIDYTETLYEETDNIEPDVCVPYLERDTVSWIHIQGTADSDSLKRLGEIFNLHPLALEDVINTGQRPKADMFDDKLFVILSHPNAQNEHATADQVSFFMSRSLVISFHTSETDPFEPIRKRLRESGGRIRKRGADYLLYTLIDLVIDMGFPVLEWYGDELENLEEELLECPTKDSLVRLHEIKRDALLLRRILWPQREVINTLIREEENPIGDDVKIYYRDCYDHTIQIMDLLETYRDMTTSMLDLYLSSTSNRLNEVMRVLTIIATIFIPLTFIAGIYGMNFENSQSPWAMPELGWYYGYPIIMLIMLGIVAALLYWFRRKDWI